MNKIDSSLRGLLFRLAGNKYRDLVIIALNWSFVVGKLLSERSSILKFENKILYIKVSNHVWLQEFVLRKPDILKKLQEKVNVEIDNILFMV